MLDSRVALRGRREVAMGFAHRRFWSIWRSQSDRPAGITASNEQEKPGIVASATAENDQAHALKSGLSPPLPERQQVLVLQALKQPYESQSDYPIPQTQGDHELLIRTSVIGLNPIDWKSVDYGFGIPQLPYLAGRELAGNVVTASPQSSRIKPGDNGLVISTDYRDGRKAAYQQYVVTNYYNVARIPATISTEAGASLGVAFVAAALSLGICTGLDFSSICDGPDILQILRGIDPDRLPADVRNECLNGIETKERLTSGDWLAVWGGSSTSAYMICQIARFAGIRTMSILDLAKHGQRQHLGDEYSRADFLIDSHDPERAVSIARATANNNLRFAIDTVGRPTAVHLLECLRPASPAGPASSGTPPATPPLSSRSEPSQHTHLVGLTGLPKETAPAGCVYHTVPIKVFHEVAEVGEALMVWLEKLLAQGMLKPPPLLTVEHGFDAVNPALDRMRKGEISGGRVVVRVD